jgi:penicillin-binding protein 2
MIALCFFYENFMKIQLSSNTYFQAVAIMVSPDAIAQVAREFGLGQQTGINLPREVAGTVPNPEWKRELNHAVINRRHEARYENLEKEYN